MGMYLDQASRFVSVTDNIVQDVKCAGFLQNFGLNCTITNNVLAFVNENIFKPGAEFSGHGCRVVQEVSSAGAAVYSATEAPIFSSDGKPKSGGAFEFRRNIVYWRQGALFGGGGSLQASTFSNNLYFNPKINHSALRASGFPCESGKSFNPSTAGGVLDDGQTLTSPQVLLSSNKTAFAAFDSLGRFCVGKIRAASPLWCSPRLAANSSINSPAPGEYRVKMQSDNNLCARAAAKVGQKHGGAWCLGDSEPVDGPHCGPACRYFAKLHDNGTFCTYNITGDAPASGDAVTWCANPDDPGLAASSNSRMEVSTLAAKLSGRNQGYQGCGLSHWQSTGHDLNSQISDPLFVDPEARDFRLKPNSPALAMGIRSLDVSTVGPRPTVFFKKEI